MIKGETKQELAEICSELECGGAAPDCPGDPSCSILRKVLFGNRSTELADLDLDELDEDDEFPEDDD